MENQKSNNKLVVTLIIIIVCLVLGGGYTIYTLLPNNSNTGTNENNNSNVSDENNDESTSDVTDTTNYNSYVVETLDGNITVEKYTNSETTEYYLQYTKKDSNNNAIWTYKTESDYAAQFDKIKTLKNLDNVLYISDKGNIVSLNKANGKVNWKNTESNNTAIVSHVIDNNQNLYIHTTEGQVKIIDSKGKTKTTIKNDILNTYESSMKIKNNELIVELNGGSNLTISLSNYSVKTTK